MIQVAHVITGLHQGGAENVLLRLLERSDRSRFSHRVISLQEPGPVGARIEGLGMEVRYLDASSTIAYLACLPRLRTLLGDPQPSVVQTWMYHADLLGGLAARSAGLHSIAWGLHSTLFPKRAQSVSMKAGLKLNAWLSRSLPSRIVCCSNETARVHSQLGYSSRKMLVIPNGFEPHVRVASPNPTSQFVIGRIGRFHPQKDFPALLRALRALVDHGKDVALELVGADITSANRALVELIGSLDLAERVRLTGSRDDLDEVYPTYDLVVSSSLYGEGLPLVLGEAMARGIPVVTTDVGDSARLVDDPERVVPSGDHLALARAIERIIDMTEEERSALGLRDLQRIETCYSLERMVNAYEDLYEEIATDA